MTQISKADPRNAATVKTTASMPPNLTEKQFGLVVEDICKWLRLPYYHTWNSQHSAPGWPDYVIVGPSGVIYVELKSQNGRVTKNQDEWLRILADAGQEVHVWRPSDLEQARNRLIALAKR